MSETTNAAKRTCALCKKPITDPIYELYWDEDMKKIFYRHKRGYCREQTGGPYAYMKREGQTKHD